MCHKELETEPGNATREGNGAPLMEESQAVMQQTGPCDSAE